MRAWSLASCLAWIACGTARAEAPPHRYTITTQSVYDTATQLTWQRSTDETPRNWSTATTYCQQLTLDGAVWRLPTIKELLTIVDPARTSNPVLDTNAFVSARAEVYWSATTWVADGKFAWTVDFAQGNSAKDHDKGTAAYVRCVH